MTERIGACVCSLRALMLHMDQTIPRDQILNFEVGRLNSKPKTMPERPGQVPGSGSGLGAQSNHDPRRSHAPRRSCTASTPRRCKSSHLQTPTRRWVPASSERLRRRVSPVFRHSAGEGTRAQLQGPLGLTRTPGAQARTTAARR